MTSVLLLLVSVFLGSALVGVEAADSGTKSKPFFNISINAAGYSSSLNLVSQAIQAYGYSTLQAEQVDSELTWESSFTGPTGNTHISIAFIVRLISKSGTAGQDLSAKNGRDLAEQLDKHPDSTFGDLKSFFSQEGLTLYSFTVVPRTTTFVFTLAENSWMKVGEGQKAAIALEKSITTSILAPSATNCQILVEFSQSSVSTGIAKIYFQFYGSSSGFCHERTLASIQGGWGPNWKTAFLANGLSLEDLGFDVPGETLPPPGSSSTGETSDSGGNGSSSLASWIKGNTVYFALIVTGIVVVVIVIGFLVLQSSLRKRKIAEEGSLERERLLPTTVKGQLQDKRQDSIGVMSQTPHTQGKEESMRTETSTSSPEKTCHDEERPIPKRMRDSFGDNESSKEVDRKVSQQQQDKIQNNSSEEVEASTRETGNIQEERNE